MKNNKAIAIAFTAATEIVIACLLGLWIGEKLDEKFGSAPWAKVSLVFSMLFIVVFHIQRLYEKSEEKEP